MQRHKIPVNTRNKEPGEDGKFDDCSKDVLEELRESRSDSEERDCESWLTRILFTQGLENRFSHVK